MALIRRWWLSLPVLVALVALVTLLPPRVPSADRVWFGLVYVAGAEVYGGASPSPYRRDVQEAVRVQETAVEQAGLSDSVLAAAHGARALRSSDGAVTVVYEAPLSADSARFWLDAASRELALYPSPGTRGMPLVVALFANPTRAGGKRIASWTVRELVDQAETSNACIVLVDLFNKPDWMRAASYVAHDASGRPVTRWLGACALYARFGSPGAMVGRWSVGDATFWYRWYPLTSQLVDARRVVRRRQLQPTIGPDDLPWWAARWLAVGCVRGAAQACLRATGLDTWGQLPYSAFMTIPPERVLAFLLASSTPQQFAALWRSPLKPDAALANAYQTPAATLVRDALRHWYEVPPAGGPHLDATAAVTGAGWAVLALLLALLAGRRWRAAA